MNLGDDPATHRSDCNATRRCGDIKGGRLIQWWRVGVIVPLQINHRGVDAQRLQQQVTVVMCQMIIVIDGDFVLIVLLVFGMVTGVGSMLMMPPMTDLLVAFMQAQLGSQTPSALDWQHQQ